MIKYLSGTDTIPRADCNKTRQMLLPFLFLSCFILSFVIACSENTPPSDLLGIWETSDEDYKDRYMEITPESLIFGVGEGQTLAHAISDITSEQEGTGIRYTFYYLDRDGEEWTLSLLHTNENGGAIVLQNRDEVWTKEEEQP